jgi:anti-sigma-K factor RskA
MTGTDPGHQHYDELAAGYALHALEPDEEWQFAAHAADCARCRAALAEYAAATAALTELAPPVRPRPDLADDILAAARRTRQQTSAPGPARPRPPAAVRPDQPGTISALAGRFPADPAPVRRPRRVLLAAGAATVALAAGIGTWAGVAGTSTGDGTPAAACSAQQHCYRVSLTAAAGSRHTAEVTVRGSSAWLSPAGLPADDSQREIYVLWQITGNRTPLAVGSFDVRAGEHAAIKVGTLASPYNGTWAFAVSLERGRSIPAHPSRPVALGQVAR